MPYLLKNRYPHLFAFFFLSVSLFFSFIRGGGGEGKRHLDPAVSRSARGNVCIIFLFLLIFSRFSLNAQVTNSCFHGEEEGGVIDRLNCITIKLYLVCTLCRQVKNPFKYEPLVEHGEEKNVYPYSHHRRYGEYDIYFPSLSLSISLFPFRFQRFRGHCPDGHAERRKRSLSLSLHILFFCHPAPCFFECGRAIERYIAKKYRGEGGRGKSRRTYDP